VPGRGWYTISNLTGPFFSLLCRIGFFFQVWSRGITYMKQFIRLGYRYQGCNIATWRDLHNSEPFCFCQPGSPLAHRLHLFATLRAQSIWFRSNLTSRSVVIQLGFQGRMPFSLQGTRLARGLSAWPAIWCVVARSYLFVITQGHIRSRNF
jgi:hypothetical protein